MIVEVLFEVIVFVSLQDFLMQNSMSLIVVEVMGEVRTAVLAAAVEQHEQLPVVACYCLFLEGVTVQSGSIVAIPRASKHYY